MSAEGKKKRGESGMSKAKANPFRLNGGGCYPLYMRSILGPELSRKIGKPLPGTRYSKTPQKRGG